MRSRRLVPFVAAAMLAVLVTACGGSDGEVRTSGTPAPTGGGPTTTAPAVPPSEHATASGTVARDAAGVDLRVVFLSGGKVATAHRRVAPTRAVARAALEQLVAGPNATEQAAGYTSRVAPGTTIGSVTIADGVATVVLSPDPTDTAARAQVVYTLTQFPTVRRVRFGTGEAVSRDDFRAVTPLVFVESVAPGDVVASPVTVSGEANTFEATVRIRVVGNDGSVLADTHTTATSGSGTWGTFSESVPFAKGANTAGKIVVFWDSPADGAPRDVVEVPVRFS